MKDDKGHDPVTGAEVPVPDTAEDVINNNEMRSELDAALASIKLFSPDTGGARGRGQDARERTRRGEAAAGREGLCRRTGCGSIKDMRSARCGPRCCSAAPTTPSAWMRPGRWALTGTPATKTLLLDRQKVEADADVKAAIAASLDQIEGRLAWGERLGVIFTGISLGFDPAAGRARPGDHLRPDGRDQHGPRRADDDRRLCHLRDPEPVQGLSAERIRRVHPAGDPLLLSRRGRRRRHHGAHRDPLPLWPAAGNACSPPGASAWCCSRRCARSSARRTCRSRIRAGCPAASP